MSSKRKRIDDYWNIDGSSRLVWSLDGFHTIYSTRWKSSWRKNLVRGEIDEENSLHPGQIICGQSYGSQWERTPSWRRSKNGLKKRFILTTHENCEESISSTPRIRSTRRPSRTHVRNWKRQLLLLCHAKLWRIVGLSDLTKTKQDLRVFWKQMNPPECVWGILNLQITKTILQEKVRIHCNNK